MILRLLIRTTTPGLVHAGRGPSAVVTVIVKRVMVYYWHLTPPTLAEGVTCRRPGISTNTVEAVCLRLLVLMMMAAQNGAKIEASVSK